MAFHLAVDAGGSSTRAVIVDDRGIGRGKGISGAGNPLSSGARKACQEHRAAIEFALDSARLKGSDITTLMIAMAGGQTPAGSESFAHNLSAGLAELGIQSRLMIESDLLATYYSGTYQQHGYALVSGTGAVAAFIDQGQLHTSSDGLGWLLGDDGSGFWLGREAARTAAAALDGRITTTALTDLILQHFRIIAATAGSSPHGSPRHPRPESLRKLIAAVYAIRPVELAQLAPYVLEAARSGDQTAKALLSQAGKLLTKTLDTVRDPEDSTAPVVLGGSILNQESQILSALQDNLPATTPVIRVADGLAGAASMALRKAGIDIGPDAFTRIKESISRL